jgi:GR25 family glycosyltransferase involved in LPS biosynthesis
MHIDKIFIINLPQRIERLEKIKDLLKKLELIDNYEIYKAVDGKELSETEINKSLSITSLHSLYVESNNHKDIRTKGAIGCFLSHYNLWKEIIKRDYDNVLIIEDDAEAEYNYDEIITYINSIPSNYNLALLSWFTLWFDKLENKKNKKVINDSWDQYKSINIFGTAVYMLNKEGAKKLIENALPINYQVDAYMNIITFLDDTFIRFVSNKNLFSSNNMGTDIQNKCKMCDVTEKINILFNKKYNIETFNIIGNTNSYNFLILIIIMIMIIIYFNYKKNI